LEILISCEAYFAVLISWINLNHLVRNRLVIEEGKEGVWNEVWSEIIVSVSFILTLLVVKERQKERERERLVMIWEGKGVFGMRFDPRSSHHIYIFFFNFPFLLDLLTFIHILLFSSLHAWDETDLGPGFIPHT